MLTFPDLELRFDTQDVLEEGAFNLVSKIRPAWPRDQMRAKPFKDGITNQLVGVYLPGDKNNMILVRIYGNNTDQIIDRDAEKRNMQLFFDNGCGPTLHASFKNGIAYDFIPGEILTIESVKDPKINQSVIEMMAKMHKMKTGETKDQRQPCCFRRLKQFLDVSPDGFPDNTDKAKRYADYKIPSKAALAKQIEEMESKLGNCNSPTVFSHNDLLLANVIIQESDSKPKATFIDYEYGDYNYQAYDLGNHFTEWAGVEGELDYDKYYPEEEVQKEWLRRYLMAYNGWDVTDEEVHKLYVLTNQFALLANLTWGIWALVQARFSAIDFDFLDYARQRLNEYFRKKDEFMSLC